MPSQFYCLTENGKKKKTVCHLASDASREHSIMFLTGILRTGKTVMKNTTQITVKHFLLGNGQNKNSTIDVSSHNLILKWT